jgi:PKD repeat protein
MEIRIRPLRLVPLILIVVLIAFGLLSACKNDESTNTEASVSGSVPSDSQMNSQTGRSQVLLGEAADWGPLETRSGSIDLFHIENNIGIGSIGFDSGQSTAGSYLYALDVTSGKLIGDVQITGSCYDIDICDHYAYLWVDGGIRVHDVNNQFKWIQTIDDKDDEWISNFGDYLYIESRQTADYLIDKKTLKRIDLAIANDDLVYELLYPDCIICESDALGGAYRENPAIYNVRTRKIIGYLPSAYLSKIYAWDPANHLFFCQQNDRVQLYDFSKENVVAELKFTKSDVYAIGADMHQQPEFYAGVGDRLHVLPALHQDSHGYYPLNARDMAYLIDSKGAIKCQQDGARMIGEKQGYSFFSSHDALGAVGDGMRTLWNNVKPDEPFNMQGPYFARRAIAWLSQCSGRKGHGDGIYQWSFETGTFSNYTEFIGWELEILAADPFIVAQRNHADGVNAKWRIYRYDTEKLPFLYVPEIKIMYQPEQIYPDITPVVFSCVIKDLPAAFQSQNISCQWDFGDGDTSETGSQTEATHVYQESGDFNVSVKVTIGQSADSTTQSAAVTVLEPIEFELKAVPQYYSENGLVYQLECVAAAGSAGKIGLVEWDFDDGGKENGILVNHTYKTGRYEATAKVYNADRSVSWLKKVQINSRFPDFMAKASSLEGDSGLAVDFSCMLMSSDLTDSGLTFQWKTGSKIISEAKSCQNVFVYAGTSTISLVITDPAGTIVKQQDFAITIHPLVINLSDGGRKMICDSSIFVEKSTDIDHDGVNQAWEDEAMYKVNPYLELDEEEDWLKNMTTDKVVNYVRVTSYPIDSGTPQYILFNYALTWTQDYGRYGYEGVGTDLMGHNGDIETIILAWQIIDNQQLQLKYVYTSAHGFEATSHTSVWYAKGMTSNTGKIWPDDTEVMTAALEFKDNILKLQTSEDKHAIYPTEACGDHVSLVAGLFGEDCGGGGEWRFACFNAGEPAGQIMDDIGSLFPNERIWSGNVNKVDHFCGGLAVEDESPGTIGSKLADIPAMLRKKLDNEKISGDYTYTVSDSGAKTELTRYFGSGGNIVIPSTMTSIGAYAFSNCTGLTSVTIPDRITSIGYGAFYGCTGLSSMTIPSHVTEIGSLAFADCTGLKSVTISAGVRVIGYGAFKYCTGLTSVTIPNSVISINDGAFDFCTGLKQVTIGNGVSNLDRDAFANCTELTNVTIGGGLRSIAAHGIVFSGCSRLAEIKFMGSAPTMPDNAFGIVSSSFRIIYISGKTGFTTPAWHGYPAYPG